MVARYSLLALILGAALVAQQPRPPAPARPAAAGKPRASTAAKSQPPASTPEASARRLLNSLSLRERVAQLVFGVADGYVYSTQSEEYERFRHWIADLHIGGLLINNRVEFGSARNANPHAMAVFINQMQRLSRVPLLIASDFEQAASMRVTGGTQFPHSMAFGAAGDIEATRYEGMIAAREARALGVHWIFAPVADVNNNPANPIINLRSYGEDPAQVARHVAAFIEGAHSDPARPVLVTAKHFPGHGDTDVDSHLGLPRLAIRRERLDEVELVPFRAAIAAGADSIMTAHISLPELDSSGVPATVSPKVLTDLLRNELMFQNIIVTDAMTMQGLTAMFNNGEAAVRSLLAGADVLLMPPDPEQAIRSVVAAVESGRISRARINQSALRVLVAKAALGIARNKLVDLDAIANAMDSPEAAARAQEIADRAVTLLKNSDRLLPLSPADPVCMVVVNSLRISQQGQRAIQAFRSRAQRGRVYAVDTGMSLAALEAAIENPRDCSAIFVASFASINANLGGVAPYIAKLAEGPVPVILAGFNDPYVCGKFPKASACVIPFSSAPPSEVAVVKALYGEIPVRGRTPVSIPNVAARGDGLQLPARTQRAAR
jgi:beta-N-acetylhexosaminidase